MSSSENAMSLSLLAGAAFVEGDFGKVVTMDSAARTVVLAAAATETPVGILGSAPAALGDVVPIIPLNGAIGKVKCGGAVAVGDLLVAAADGEVVDGGANVGALAADVVAVGIALEAGVDQQIIEAQLMLITSSTET